MKITKIDQQVKNRDRYSVYIDDAFSFGISESGLLEYKLHIGSEVNEEQLAELKSAANTDRIYSLTLALIARRPRSKWEIIDYLKRKKTDQPAADQIVNKLINKGYIDDEDFARRWIESRRLAKPISIRKLNLELRAKRVDAEIITKVLADSQINEDDMLMQEIAKKRRLSKYHDDLKLMQYLARQGYRYDDIKRALSSYEFED